MMNSLLINKIGYPFLFMSCLQYHAQISLTSNKIDSLQTTEFGRLAKTGNFKKIILQEKELIRESSKLNYSKGEIKGYINLATALSGIGRYKEGLLSLQLAEKKLKTDDDISLEAELHFRYGQILYQLGIYQQAVKSFNASLYFSYKIKDKEEREKIIYDNYDWKWASFTELNMMDSANSYERKCMRSPRPILYITIAQRHLNHKNIDSAEFYINKAKALLIKKGSPFEGKSNVLRAFGELYIAKKDNAKALDYLFASLAISQKMGFKTRTLETYKLISDAYKNLNNIEKGNEFLAKYAVVNDSIVSEQKNALNVPIEKFLKDQTEKDKEKRKHLYYLILILTFASAGIILLIRNIYAKKQQLQNALIAQSEEETIVLKKKLDFSHKELVQLAMEDSPFFINRFKELYPDFSHLLLSQYPHLTPGDFKFCAFIKLNFSNKEIANYCHMSIRTVESKKYRLRKKIGIPIEIDVNTWVLEL